MNKLAYIKPELTEEFIELEDICCLSVNEKGDGEGYNIPSYKITGIK